MRFNKQTRNPRRQTGFRQFNGLLTTTARCRT
ncbi:Uncharacterised protein [Vibrio cholerae]|nr:Uncharacterised protein [Vibrio cholerae]